MYWWGSYFIVNIKSFTEALFLDKITDMNIDFTTILGIIGAMFILVAFILEQKKIWNNEMLRYDLVNFIGSAILVVYGILIKGYPFVVLNLVWASVSLFDVVTDVIRNNKTKN